MSYYFATPQAMTDPTPLPDGASPIPCGRDCGTDETDSYVSQLYLRVVADRNTDCIHYEACLDHAACLDWPGWSCASCAAYVPEVVHAEPLRVDDPADVVFGCDDDTVAEADDYVGDSDDE